MLYYAAKETHGITKNQTVHSPLFLCKIIKIECGFVLEQPS